MKPIKSCLKVLGVFLLLSQNIFSQFHNAQDSLTLIAIDILCDKHDSLNWNTEPDPENWDGITWDSLGSDRVIGIDIANKKLSGALDLTSFESLEYLNCSWNNIELLLLGDLSNLKYINCYKNNLSTLDIGMLSAIEYVDCKLNNQLTSLKILGFNNRNLQYLNCYGNPISEMDLTELRRLKELEISGSRFDTLVFSLNDSLLKLSCNRVGLKHLDISRLTQLEYLECGGNSLTELNLENQPHLTYLSCGSNELSALDLEHLTSLSELICYNNDLTELDLSATNSIWWLDCEGNQLMELDISGQPAVMVNCPSNKLTKLTIGNQHDFIQYFNCSNNQLTDIDLSGVSSFGGCELIKNKLPFTSLSTGLAAGGLSCNPQNKLYEPDTLFSDITLDYSAEALINTTPTTFIFYKNAEEAETNNTGLYNTTGPGEYFCEMTNSLFPELVLTTSTITINSPVNLASEKRAQIEIFPIPASSSINIALPESTLPYSITLFSSTGELIKTYHEIVSHLNIPVDHLEKGSYYIEVEHDKIQCIKHVIVL